MRKNLVGVILSLGLIFTPIIANAKSSCSYSEQAELNNIAANVKANYEATEVFAEKAVNPDIEGAPEVDVYKKILKISILNIIDDIYVKVTNSKTNEEKTYRVSDTTDGVITFNHEDIDSISTYKIDIYANKYSCAGELIRTFDFIAPQYNFYSQLEACSTYPEYYYCQEFIPTDNISYDSFLNNVEKMKEKNEEEKQKEEEGLFGKVKEFYKKNKIAIDIAGCIIVVGGITATVILIKKRRGRVL